MLIHIVQHLGSDVSTVEPSGSGCTPFRSITLEKLLGQSLQRSGQGYMTPLHMISHMAGLRT
jgi:hypothetical protein